MLESGKRVARPRFTYGVGRTYASDFTYAARGAVAIVHTGNQLWEHTQYNSRLQPWHIGLGSSILDSSLLLLSYDYGTSANNGNVLHQDISVPGGRTFNQSYTYDPLNRLLTATEQGWVQGYGYDRYGNRWVLPGSYIPTTQGFTPQSESMFNPQNNRLEQGCSTCNFFDASGNQKADMAGNSYDYDGEDRQTGYNGGVASYTYDGDGRRVRKTEAGGPTTIFVYDAMDG